VGVTFTVDTIPVTVDLGLGESVSQKAHKYFLAI